MEPLSVFVTTFNNADTLDACLGSVAFADEIVLLDSFSTDATLDIARRHGCRVFQHEFLGYGPQKQMALGHTRHDWVLLMDADEMLTPALAEEIRALLARGPDADGYEIPRREQVFWRLSHPGVRWNRYLRLFDKRQGRVTEMPVHAAPEVEGRVGRLRHPFVHFGEKDIHTKVDKINHYSTGLVADKLAKGRSGHPLVMVLWPPLFFLRSFFLKRGFLNGWAGLIASVTAAFYVFLKYAKLHEHRERRRHADPFESATGTVRQAPPAEVEPAAPERERAAR